MATIAECAAAVERLCAAFGRKPTPALVAEYHTVFNSLSAGRLNELVGWGIETLEVSFPPIASLRRLAIDEGWCGRKPGPSASPDWIDIECPRCGASFVIRRERLVAEVKRGVTYECPNRLHWNCEERFPGWKILDNTAGK